MSSCIDFLANAVWTEADILAHGRAVIASHVPVERQIELQTIMLGHMAGMRTATPSELAEIAEVQRITELTSTANALARADMALLQEVLDYEADPEGKTLSPMAQDVYNLRHPVEVVGV